jgi:hypothetical protein
MAFESTLDPSRKFSMASRRNAHDRGLRAKMNQTTKTPETMLQAPGQEDDESPDAAAVVAEHGPAHEVRIEHRPDEHHVHSSHEDGHEHHSVHSSKSEAHDTARELAGPDEGDEQPMEDPGDEGEY